MSAPTQFGPYLLLERISVGGMAEVYKAKEYGVEGFERTVAVKRILPHVAEDEDFIAMFKDEAKIAVQLNHGNIAQIYNLGNEQDSFYIALEYVHGRDLRAIFQRCQQQGKAMPVAQACYVIMKICEGLDYAHNKKDKYNRELHIVHRDVSPPNILVSFEGEVKLIDFGVAKAAGRASRTQAGILKGKFGYMSPEQVRGMPLDRRSDVFSVGVVLFEILTGTRLFQADTDFATLEKVRAVEVPRPSSLSPDLPKPLENIIYKALAREPEPRYQSAIDLHDELQAFMFAQGLFYSRKDLASWMRQQYAREIEIEKEKVGAADRSRPNNVLGTMPPPPPPPASSRSRGPTPAPAARGATPGRPPPPPPPAPRSSTPAPDPDAPQSLAKRKTMVMTTARPNLPPTLPPTTPLPASPILHTQVSVRDSRGGADASARTPGPKLPRPTSSNGVSSAADAGAADAGAKDFDWEDEELETRLFAGEDDRTGTMGPAEAVSPGAGAGADRPPATGGELAASAAFDGSDPQIEAPSVTVLPSAGAQASPGPAGLTTTRVATPGAPGDFSRAPATMVSPGIGAEAMGVPGGTQASPVYAMPPFADEPLTVPRHSAGLLITLSVAVLALLGVGFSAVYFYTRDRTAVDGDGIGGANVAASAGEATHSALTVQTTPAKVDLWVDGRAIPGPSPYIVSDLVAGDHRVVAKAPGYLPFERDIHVGAGGLNLPLVLQRSKVTLVLESDPPGATMALVVNGKPTPMGTAGSRFELTREADATYEVEANAPGFSPTKVPLRLSGEPIEKVRVVLTRSAAAAASDDEPSRRASGRDTPSRSRPRERPEPKPSSPSPRVGKTATLKVGTNPGVLPAQVFVDGKSVGMTPIPNLAVSPGRHKVTWKWSNGREVSMTVEINSGQTKLLKNG